MRKPTTMHVNTHSGMRMCEMTLVEALQRIAGHNAMISDTPERMQAEAFRECVLIARTALHWAGNRNPDEPNPRLIVTLERDRDVR